MANPQIVVLPQPTALAPAGTGTVLSLGRELVARVAAVAADGAMFLKIGNSLVAARSEEPLQAGDVLRLQVSEAGKDRVVLKLLPEAPAATVDPRPPADQRAALVRQLTAQLASQLGARTAAGIAELVAARAVSTGAAPLLAARMLAQQSSPLALLRELAGSRPQADALLKAIEQDLVSGDPARVRSALSRLGLDQEHRLASGKLTEPSTLKSMTGPDGETAVSAQQILLQKPESDPLAPVFLFLPLPDGGQARLVVQDDSEQERSDGHFSLRGELDLARTGTVSFQLQAVEQAAVLTIKSPDDAVVDHLREGAQPLVRALERALGIPVSVTIAQSAEGAPSPIAVNFERTDLYV